VVIKMECGKCGMYLVCGNSDPKECEIKEPGVKDGNNN